MCMCALDGSSGFDNVDVISESGADGVGNLYSLLIVLVESDKTRDLFALSSSSSSPPSFSANAVPIGKIGSGHTYAYAQT